MKDKVNHLIEESDSSAWYYLVLERKGFVLRKILTIFRRKKYLKSKFIQKIIIKDVGFSSFYHEKNFNYLRQMLALQH